MSRGRSRAAAALNARLHSGSARADRGLYRGVVEAPTHPRLRALPRAEVLGGVFPVAETRRSRLLGLSFLDRSTVGPGLLIPRCRSVHTFGMRFPLDLYFLGRGAEVVGVRLGVRPWRVAGHRGGDAVLELPPEDLDAA
jgi:uncharacterized protein